MITFAYAVGIPLAVYIVARQLTRHWKFAGNRWILIAACLLFATSLFIPSPQIHGEDTEFVTHLLGGGFFVGLLWLYFRPLLGKHFWYVEVLQLFVFASVLGVANELLELFLYETHLTLEPLTDTSWDLVANTTGILLFYGIYRAIKYGKGLFLQR